MNAAALPAAALLDATLPPERRGVARDGVALLVTDRATRTHTHAHFYDLPEMLRPGDVLAVNDSATVPAALSARRRGGEPIMVHLSTHIGGELWMAEPRGCVEPGEALELPGGARALAIAPADREHPRVWFVRFDVPVPMNAYLAQHGTPISYGYVTERLPLSDYQTIFAREPGSSEMPSAARPFTPRVVRALNRRGITLAAITLHCGVASFEQPERPSLERYHVSMETAALLNRARAEKRRIIAVGTTVVRALESASENGEIVASSGWTDLVVDESHRITSVDGLISGFHDAQATHQLMLRAFLDSELLAEAYAEATRLGYHRHEFGDSHLIL